MREREKREGDKADFGIFGKSVSEYGKAIAKYEKTILEYREGRL
ncbi:MAG: hypothetical protein ACLRSW_07180 [Christensenellaceae bacterium]